ncbi:hypothetical protein HXX02_17155 [Microbulbifer elongatus]|uniref:Uncharacterized protein n=1 Tax=Microbulbifer elongatus TaxID=86173 RepID=A0ABT1P843_9GAMM|nr:hypothetical protein [Microbulbifer elongatus]MCQ3831164.1 hypothetical protein [Microbulbifer elongatus]
MNNEAKSGMQVYLDYLREHWALAASLGYLYLTSIGMIQSGILFSRYEINIFEFSEINDFLLAAFREPVALIAGFAVLGYVGVAFSILYKRRGSPFSSGSLFKSKAMKFNIVISALCMPILVQVLFSDFINRNYERSVTVELRRGSLPGIKDANKPDLFLIGTSENFVFVHEKKMDKTFIIPRSNLVAVALNP